MAAFVRHFMPRLPQRVRVNLNAITEDGLVRIRRTHFEQPVRPGSLVRIVEPVDEIEGFATVARVNAQTGLVYLDVAWDSLRDSAPLHLTCALDAAAATARPPQRIGEPRLLAASG
jgi:hypothetical protein